MRKGFILLVLALCFGLIPASAQDEDNPLLRMLARIPDTPAAREWLTYVDYDALIAARPGAPSIASWDEFDSIFQEDGDERSLFMSALMSIQSGPRFFSTYFMQGGEIPEVVGFDLFDIGRAVEYGEPPATVTLLEGDFDADAVAAAHEARDYTQTQTGDLTLLCPTNGCDSGMQTDFANRNLANPFGGELGRSQPVLLGDQLVASSADHQALNGVAAVLADDEASLADDPDYRAAAEALAASGTPLQAYFIRPLEVNSVSAALLANPRMTQEQIEQIRERLETDFVPLPQYNLVALGHAATETEELALIALVYGDREDAEAAAEMFPARLEDYTSLATMQPFLEILSDRGVTSIDATIHEASSERATLVITLRSPVPSPDVPDDGSQLQVIGLPYAILVRAYMQRDLGWLATEF